MSARETQRRASPSTHANLATAPGFGLLAHCPETNLSCPRQLREAGEPQPEFAQRQRGKFSFSARPSARILAAMSQTDEMIVTGPSSIHGTGMFATRACCAGERVIEYLGERINKEESLRRCENGNQFIFYLDEQWNLDGGVEWNPARFLNHSCAPNCDAEWIDGHIWMVARRAIVAGEELTFNYGYDLAEFREHPCRCGSANCAGYIVAEELFDNVRGR